MVNLNDMYFNRESALGVLRLSRLFPLIVCLDPVFPLYNIYWFSLIWPTFENFIFSLGQHAYLSHTWLFLLLQIVVLALKLGPLRGCYLIL
jgi:hypothetical protein